MENDLKFTGVTPVILNYNGSIDDIYAPVRTSSLDVNIVSNQILDDLYTGRKDEIGVRLERREPKKEREIDFTYDGSVVSSVINTNVDQYHTIYYRNLFFQDIDGLFRFNGQIQDNLGNVEDVNILFNTSTNKWRRNNAWNLEIGDQYFHDGTYSYKTHWTGSVWTISRWESSGWGTPTSYYVGGSDTSAPKTDNIVHYADGTIELLFGKNRYTWDASNMEWDTATAYVDSDGGDYFAIYGKDFNRVKLPTGVYVDTVIVNDYDGGSEQTEWIVTLDKTTGTFTRLIPLKENSWNSDYVFTYAGAVYYVDIAGDIWYWSWDIESWVKWIHFTGNYTANSFGLDYVVRVSGEVDTVVVKYYDTDNSGYGYIYLTDFVEPRVEVTEHVIPGEFVERIIWEGYKMPNTYTQDVTQNLDTISMTCIDPVSLMKYVKIDKIMTRPSIKTFGELIGKALSYVMLSSRTLMLERTVTYGADYYYYDNGLFDLKCQVSNFWDEGGEPSTLYEMIEEMLRPFCLTLAYENDTYWIYNTNKTSGQRLFDRYDIRTDGSIFRVQEQYVDTNNFYFGNDWISNNVQNASIEIGAVYDKVSGVSSTSIPSYSTMAGDLVNYNDRDAYDAFWCNVQRNKSKGYRKSSSSSQYVLDTNDYWFFLWNGVYTNDDYGLESYITHSLVNGYMNINGAYKYLTGETGNPNDIGSVLNFSGGMNNPTGTGKSGPEKSVEISDRITAYSYDNGTPPEFLEPEDLMWNFDNTDFDQQNPRINKPDYSNAKFGTGSIDDGDGSRVVYHQQYDNMTMSSQDEQDVNVQISQAYSRTGINTVIDVLNNNSATNQVFYLNTWDEYQYYQATIKSASVCYYPYLWNSDNVSVDSMYFGRYATGHDFRITPFFDRRRVDVYVRLSDSTILQFNGREWVEDTEVKKANSFYLMKMMNYNKLFNTDYKYNIIEVAPYEENGTPVPAEDRRYSLMDEDIVYYTDNYDGVVQEPKSSHTAHTYKQYRSDENTWNNHIISCSEGGFTVRLPYVDDTQASVIIDIWNSNMLGMTGTDDYITNVTRYPVPVVYEVSGTGEYTYEGQTTTITLTAENCEGYGGIRETPSLCNFIPVNVSHVKAEHLDMTISVTVPKSNLGQMFNESDIKYEIDQNKGFDEESEQLSFRVNTKNQLVKTSFSYIIFDNNVADPTQFYLNKVSVRPECYTLQAYMNWLGTIRKTYSKTLVPHKVTDRPFSNVMTNITSPEVGLNQMTVISDSIDIKTNRHTIKAVENNNLEVESVYAINVIELPRQARNERWNLPTAVKN